MSDTQWGNGFAPSQVMKVFAAGTLLWSALVVLYVFSPFAGVAALSAGFGYVARVANSPVRVRVR